MQGRFKQFRNAKAHGLCAAKHGLLPDEDAAGLAGLDARLKGIGNLLARSASHPGAGWKRDQELFACPLVACPGERR